MVIVLMKVYPIRLFSLFIFFFSFNLLLKSQSAFQGYIEWQKVYGGSYYDWPFDVVRTFDRGFAIAGWTISPNDFYVHDKRGTGGPMGGNNDFWIVRIDSIGDTLWTRCYGGTANDLAFSIVQTCDSGFAITGYTSSTDIDIQSSPNGQEDLWVVKIDKNGNLEWERTYGGLLFELGEEIIQTFDGGYAVTGFARSGDDGFDVHGNKSLGISDYWLLRLDANGDTIWTRTYGSTGADEARTLTQGLNGNIIVAGYANTIGGDIDTIHGLSSDIWVIEVDYNTSDIVRQISLGGDMGEDVESIISTYDGGYAIIGLTNSDSTGNVSTHIYGSRDAWVIKLDNALNIQWENTLGGLNQDYGYSIRQTCDSGYILGITTESPGIGGEKTEVSPDSFQVENYWLIRLDKNGNKIWDKVIGSIGVDREPAIEITDNGGILVSGHSSGDGGMKTDTQLGIIAIAPDYWVVKLRDTVMATACIGNNSFPSFSANFTADTVCTGDSTTFLNFSIGNPTNYFWDFGDGNTSTNISPSHLYDGSGKYLVSLTTTSGCLSDTYIDSIYILDSLFSIHLLSNLYNINTASRDPVICDNEQITISAYNPNKATYIWSTGETDSIITINTPGVYSVSIKNSKGNCKTTDSVEIISCKALFIPNAFSPDGDGKNDEFIITAKGVEELQLKVYNQFGQNIYEINSANITWDGKVSNKPAPTGIYIYTLDGSFLSGDPIHIRGNLTLVR